MVLRGLASWVASVQQDQVVLCLVLQGRTVMWLVSLHARSALHHTIAQHLASCLYHASQALTAQVEIGLTHSIWMLSSPALSGRLAI